MTVQSIASTSKKSREIMGPHPEFVQNRAFIGGEWVEARTKKTFGVTNPADLTLLSTLPDMSSEDVTDAIDAAEKAFALWSRMLPLDRANILSAWSRLIVENVDDLALLMTCEQGKPLKESQNEILGSAATIQWCAEEGRRLYGDFIEGGKPGTKILISRHPVGIVGAITPWNFPTGMITRKVGPALAAGCTIVFKPAEATPLSALALAVLAQRAGLPKGVLNIVTSTQASEIGMCLTSDARVRKISFTGSTGVGRKLMAQASEHIQKISLELGGNAPFIVFPTADLEKAADGAIASKFRNAGQTCICANRLYIHQNIYTEFLRIFMQKVSALKVGAGWEKDVSIGPLIDLKAVEKLERLIADALKSGAKLLTGGKRHALGTSFFEPTVIENDNESVMIAREEIFGPVAVIYKFSSDDDLIARANDTPFGLSAYLYSGDMAQVWKVSDALQFGMVGVNEPMLGSDLAPFGGVKESGIGREGGSYGLLEYTDIKYRLLG